MRSRYACTRAGYGLGCFEWKRQEFFIDDLFIDDLAPLEEEAVAWSKHSCHHDCEDAQQRGEGGERSDDQIVCLSAWLRINREQASCHGRECERRQGYQRRDSPQTWLHTVILSDGAVFGFSGAPPNCSAHPAEVVDYQACGALDCCWRWA